MNHFHLMIDSGEEPEVQRRPLTLKQLGDLYISYLLEINEGNITRTAEALGVTRRTLQRKLARQSSTR